MTTDMTTQSIENLATFCAMPTINKKYGRIVTEQSRELGRAAREELKKRNKYTFFKAIDWAWDDSVSKFVPTRYTVSD